MIDTQVRNVTNNLIKVLVGLQDIGRVLIDFELFGNKLVWKGRDAGVDGDLGFVV